MNPFDMLPGGVIAKGRPVRASLTPAERLQRSRAAEASARARQRDKAETKRRLALNAEGHRRRVEAERRNAENDSAEFTRLVQAGEISVFDGIWGLRQYQQRNAAKQ